MLAQGAKRWVRLHGCLGGAASLMEGRRHHWAEVAQGTVGGQEEARFRECVGEEMGSVWEGFLEGGNRGTGSLRMQSKERSSKEGSLVGRGSQQVHSTGPPCRTASSFLGLVGAGGMSRSQGRGVPWGLGPRKALKAHSALSGQHPEGS